MKKRIIIGGTLEEAGQRFIDAWHRAERGENVEPQDNITFLTWSSLARVMSDKRHELLQHLHRHPEPNIRALATALKRDYKNVYDDVKALTDIGLIEHTGKKLSAAYDEINATIML